MAKEETEAENSAEQSAEVLEVAPEDAAASEQGDEPVADAAAQIEALKDQALRAQAEMENVRRRAARDVENAHKYALERFAADLLPVLDSLEKAVEAAEESGVDGAEGLSEGVGLSLKLFLTTCAKAGIDQVDPHGEPFDPQLHEAIAMVPNPDAEPNSVMEVMQKGYTLNGRLVRAAKVVVASAPDQQAG
jgi:molecular chaperone GrpE